MFASKWDVTVTIVIDRPSHATDKVKIFARRTERSYSNPSDAIEQLMLDAKHWLSTNDHGVEDVLDWEIHAYPVDLKP